MSKRRSRGRRPAGPGAPPAGRDVADRPDPDGPPRPDGGNVRVARPVRPRSDEVFDQEALEPLPEGPAPPPVQPAPVVPTAREPHPEPAPPTDVPAAARVARMLLRPRVRRVDVAVAALLGILGFAVAVQVRSTQDDGLLASARQEDLVRILDDLSNRSDRLRSEVEDLTTTRDRLTTGTDRGRAAVEQARRRAEVLGVLAGTVPAEGPGVLLTVADPDGTVRADALLDALEELRDAGAEALQLEGRPEGGTTPVARVVASTSFVDDDEGVRVDGTLLRPPYRFTVVGAPETIVRALAIPGGVEDNIASQGGTATVEQRDRVRVGALRPLVPPRYARPAPGASASAD